MFKRLAAAAVAAVMSFSAVADDYYVVVPFPGKGGAENIAMSLASYPLPVARVSEAYAFDLNSVLTVTGTPHYNPADVSWAISSGGLPSGIALVAGGQLAGTPGEANEAGAAFAVTANYRNRSAQQSYTLVVGAPALRVAASGSYSATTAVAPDVGESSVSSSVGVVKRFYLRNAGAAGRLVSDVEMVSPTGAFTIESVRKASPYAWIGSTEACGTHATRRTGCAADDRSADYHHLVIDVRFKPTVEGLHEASVVFTHNGEPSDAIVVPLAGIGVREAPPVAVSGAYSATTAVVSDFGEVSTTSTTGLTKKVYLRHTGTQGQIASDVTVDSASGAFSIASVRKVNVYGTPAGSELCGTHATQRTACTPDDRSADYYHLLVEVRFKPTQGGAQEGSLTFAHNGSPAGPIVVPLTGTGVVFPPQVELSAAYQSTTTVSGAYGDVSATSAGATKKVYLRNAGAAGQIISNVAVDSASGAFTIASVRKVNVYGTPAGTEACGTHATQRASCAADDRTASYYHLMVEVRFTPTVAGEHEGTLTLTHNGSTTTPVVVPLSGNGVVYSPAVAVSGSFNSATAPVSDFGDVATTSAGVTKRVYLRNTGTVGQIASDVSVSSPTGAFTILAVRRVAPYGWVAGNELCGTHATQRTGCKPDDRSADYHHLMVELRFKPGVVGQHEATLTLTHNGTPAGPAVVSVTGAGI